jgi:uncharacterized membrane protein YdbT with pleckstrin-like domain
MTYTDQTSLTGEHVISQGHLHNIIFAPAICLAFAGVIVLSISGTLGLLMIACAIASALGKVIKKITTEIAVTSERVVYKTGLIRRATSEMNVHKVESVLIHQSILGRMLNFGTVIVRGTGQGIEPLYTVAEPLALRRSMLEAGGN